MLMKLENIKSLQRLMVFFVIIFLPFQNIPQAIQIPFLGGFLSYYPLIVGLLFVLLESILLKSKIDKFIITFILVYLMWGIISLIYGIVNYQYYESLDLLQSEKIKRIIEITGITQGGESDKITKMGILFARSLKMFFMEIIRTFGLALLVIYAYNGEFKKGFNFFSKTVMVLLSILLVFTIPEILYYKFNFIAAKNFMETINPYFYDVKIYLGWYPPLIWPNQQVRSLCLEPGEFAAQVAFCIPVFWYYFNRYRNIKFMVVFIYLSTVVFMTKARTGTGFLILETILMPFYYVLNRMKKINIILLLAATLTGYYFNILPGVNLGSYNTESFFSPSISSEEYYKKNIETIVSKDARSNRSRFISSKRNMEVALEHFFIGTGYGLKDKYVIDKLSDEDLKDTEIKNIKNTIEQKGIFHATYGNIGYIISVFANMGIIGLTIYILPFIYIIRRIVCRKLYRNIEVATLIFTMLVVSTRLLICNSMMHLYIVLGLLYVASNDTHHTVEYDSINQGKSNGRLNN